MSSSNATASSSRDPAPGPGPAAPLPPVRVPPAHKASAQVIYDLSVARDAASASDSTWQDATESSLEWILSLRPRVAPSDKGKERLDHSVVHWFCGADGAEECWESSVFLVRLLSFKRQGDVADWRDRFDELMLSCCSCVEAYQHAKRDFVDRYLSVLKTERAIQLFSEGVERAELAAVVASLKSAGLSVPSADDPSLVPPAPVDLATASLAAVHNCLVNPELFQRDEILAILSSGLPIGRPLDLPPTVSPGLLALRMHESRIIREWTQQQLDTCELVSLEQYQQSGLGQVMDAHLDLMASRDRQDSTAPTALYLAYTTVRRHFWEGLAACLGVLSPDAFRSNLLRRSAEAPHGMPVIPLDIVHLVASHLSDQEDHLGSVLACFRLLLDRLGPHVWSAGEERYEEVVLHAILGNPAFEAAFTSDTSLNEQTVLDWLPPFLASVAHSPQLFTNSLAIISSTFLDQLQHLRFDVASRTRAIEVALSILTDVFVSTSSAPPTSSSADLQAFLPKFPHAQEAAKVLELHAAFLARLAFDARYGGEEWKSASESARTFMGRITERDSKRLRDAIYALGQFGINLEEVEARRKRRAKAAAAAPGTKGKQEKIEDPLPPPIVTYSKAIWDRSYETIKDSDSRGIGILLRGATASCHLEKLTSRTWLIKNRVRPQMKAINDALDSTLQRLIPLLMALADERTDILLDFLAQPGVDEHLTMLLLSPVEEIHNTAQGLVKQAFDVTTRRECFRSLLFQFPDATLKGLSFGIRAFVKSSRTIPEACGMAKRVVRCLSDVIDVLCAATDGLLRDAAFVARGNEAGVRSRLQQLWKQMCEALALLFKKTPAWATYFENDQMTEWMRDAIIFGVDLVEQVRTFEMAITGRLAPGQTSVPASPLKTSTVANTMISAMNDPLEELIAWLRLNDEDLLSSSFDLVRAMLARFARSAIPLRPTTVAKLRKITDKGRKKDAPIELRSSILRDDQLRELVEALDANEGGRSGKDGKEAHKDWWTKAQASAKAKGRLEMISIDDDDDVKGSKKLKKPTSSSAARPASSSASSSSKHGTWTSTSTSFPFGKSTTARPSSAALKPVAKGPNFVMPAMRNAPRPRGVPWTNYSSKATIESSDESSDDDDEVGTKLTGVALLAQAQKGDIKIKKTAERRTVKMMDLEAGKTKAAIGLKAKQDAQHAANAARLRGVQDFSQLYRQILQWDSNHDGPLPPSRRDQLQQVATSFDSPESYIAAFEPLLLAECWEQVRTAKVEAAKENQVIPCTIAGRQAVDDFTDVFLTVEHGKMPDKMYIGESDLVLLRQGTRQVLAKVQSFKKTREFSEITLRCHLGTDVTEAGPGMSARTKWEMVKLYSLSTIHREYSALQSVRYLDLFDDILNPLPPPSLPFDSRRIDRTMTAYQVNEPQANAILGALRTQGFSLIQGPPGTGKTKTIVGLIGAFIDSRPQIAAPIVVGRPTDPATLEPVAKVLLCAPSNAAVDEVAKRLKDGIRNSDGQHFVPKVVRIGSDSAVDISVKDIFLDELVERALSGDKATSANAGNDAQAKMLSMRQEIDGLRGARDAKLAEIQGVQNNQDLVSQLHAQLKTIKSQIFELSQRLDSEKDKAQQSRRAMDAAQRKMRLKILSEADVICATLSGSGHDYMAQLPFDFDTVIIDEAAQSVELSSLIPLKYGCRRCVLVGDPLQLPPTVISPAAKQAGYERSLFVRMMERGRGSHLLSIQYRMHPNISAFPSAAFYDSRLTDGPDMAKKTVQPWHSNVLFPPYSFFHVRDSNEVAGRHHSWTNPREAHTALAIYERLCRDFPSVDFAYRIGIVTPYKGQVWELKQTFRRRFGDEILAKISFNTVDGFQGQEKDIIILSCVRGGSADKGIGFLSDTRRMNVALTRARSSLFILGDSNKLQSNRWWSSLVNDAQSRGLLSQVDARTFQSLTPSVPAVRAAVVPSTAKPLVTPAFVAPILPPKVMSAATRPGGSAPVASKLTSGPFSTSTAIPAKRLLAGEKLKMPAKAEAQRVVAVATRPDPVVKSEDGAEQPEPKKLKPSPPAPQPKPTGPPPPPRPKAKPSLFMPKKRPGPPLAGGPAKR